MTGWVASSHGVTALGALYVLFARGWPHFFERELVAAGQPVPEGWRLGRSIAWRLPMIPAIVILFLSGTSSLATLVSTGWTLLIPIGLLGTLFTSLWLFASPGQRLLLSDATAPTGPVFYIFRGEGRPLRALVVFALGGALPSIALTLALFR